MKKAILFLICFALFIIPFKAICGWYYAGVDSGGVSCTSCSPSVDIFNAGVTTDANTNTTYWRAWKFTLAATKCVTGITFEVFDGGAAGNVIFDIRTDSAGSPGSVVSGCTVTVDNADITDSYAQGTEASGDFSIQTLTAGDYWVVLRLGTMANFTFGYDVIAAQDVKYSDDSGSTWAASDYCLQSRVKGCDPS